MNDLFMREGMPGLRATCEVIWGLSLPAIIEQVMITMVQYVDTAMVGSLGSAATAAVGLTASTTWLINGFLSAAAIGFSVQVAQHVGAGERERAQNVTTQSIVFIAVGGLLMMTLAALVSGALPRWLGADEQVRPLASAYFRIIACAVPFNFCALMLGSIIRCAGDTRTPMLLNLFINALNIFLNFLLIYPSRSVSVLGKQVWLWGAGMGVSGAALGSLLSLAVVSGLFFWALYRRPSPVRPQRGASYRFTAPVLQTAWRLGLPVAMERTLTCAAQIVITAVITRLGTAAIAANHLAVTAESLSYMPAYGVAAAATTMVGQAMGAGRMDLAKRFSRLITYLGVAMMTAGGALLYGFAPNLIRLFSADPEVLGLGTKMLRIVAFAEPCFGMAIVVTGVLRGAGDTKAPFLISLFTMWGVRITLALTLSGPMGLAGVWVAMAIELCIRGGLFVTRMYRGKWLKLRLFEGEKAQ